ncbi:Hpt domain-containing protein [Variovorax sp. OV329]|uniref:Hpt domain-containing protein n=1 Tax=Variovorax sp. OV329 TaxID=1882825 RepID=UPI0008ED886F|nr:Hpt domain-containing protein [Variovorax sp. OV329]SFN19455.1 HPt (histidine-containing phosphotransfer) domain-containing protein [Variovorax sp. OV329]
MTDIIDTAAWSELEQTAGADFVGELVQTFLEEAPTLLQALRDAFAAGDADAFRRNAHSLKSNGLTFGALGFAAKARALEQGGLPAATQAALDELHDDWQGVVVALEERIGNG